MNSTTYPNLGQLLNQLPYSYYYPQADQFLELNLPLANFHSLPLPPGLPPNSGQILSHFTPPPSPTAILPFKPSAKIEHICRRNQWLLLASSAQTNRLLEDKHQFTTLAQKHQLPLIPHLLGPLSPDLITRATTSFGPDLVIQTHFGWAGLSTYAYHPKSPPNIPPATPVKIMPLLTGTTLTNNCARTRWGTIIGPPALQINGLPALSRNPFATTGRQWPSSLPPSLVSNLFKLAHRVDQFLADFQFRGFYGVDYFIAQDQIYILEINPRLTASVNFYTQLELKNNIVPTIYWHMAEFLGLPLPQTKFDFGSYYYHPLSGAEITPKSDSGKTIKKIWLDHPLSRQFPPVYDLNQLDV